MRFLTTLAMAVCLSLSGTTANASVAWCFGGGWGSMYAPTWGGGYGTYRPYGYGAYRPYYGGYYAAGYGGCSTCACSPCNCSPCGPAACGTGCGAACSGSFSSDKVPAPKDDPGFRDGVDRDKDRDLDQDWRRGRDDYDNSDRTRPGSGSRDMDEDSGFPRRERPDFLDKGNSRDDALPDTDKGRFDRLSPDNEPDDDFGRGIRGSDDEPDDGSRIKFGDDPLGSEDLNGFENRRKPTQEEPVDDADEEPATGKSDIVVPPADEETGPTEAQLFRGVLSARQARTGVSSESSRFRLAGHQQRERQQRSARWSGREHKQQRPVKWIGAPARNGRVRL